jgi:hypothetical protein
MKRRLHAGFPTEGSYGRFRWSANDQALVYGSIVTSGVAGARNSFLAAGAYTSFAIRVFDEQALSKATVQADSSMICLFILSLP